MMLDTPYVFEYLSKIKSLKFYLSIPEHYWPFISKKSNNNNENQENNGEESLAIKWIELDSNPKPLGNLLSEVKFPFPVNLTPENLVYQIVKNQYVEMNFKVEKSVTEMKQVYEKIKELNQISLRLPKLNEIERLYCRTCKVPLLKDESNDEELRKEVTIIPTIENNNSNNSNNNNSNNSNSSNQEVEEKKQNRLIEEVGEEQGGVEIMKLQKVFAMPSENWIELSELWVCHGSQTFLAFPREEIRAISRSCLISDTFLLLPFSVLRLENLHEHTASNNHEEGKENENDWTTVSCQCCSQIIGQVSMITNERSKEYSCKFFKYQISNSLCDSENIFRFVLIFEIIII
jgi:RNase P subunit RPR2